MSEQQTITSMPDTRTRTMRIKHVTPLRRLVIDELKRRMRDGDGVISPRAVAEAIETGTTITRHMVIEELTALSRDMLDTTGTLEDLLRRQEDE